MFHSFVHCGSIFFTTSRFAIHIYLLPNPLLSWRSAAAHVWQMNFCPWTRPWPAAGQSRPHRTQSSLATSSAGSDMAIAHSYIRKHGKSEAQGKLYFLQRLRKENSRVSDFAWRVETSATLTRPVTRPQARSNVRGQVADTRAKDMLHFHLYICGKGAADTADPFFLGADRRGPFADIHS